MAIESNITENDLWFRGSSDTLRYVIYDDDGVTPKDISGWTVKFYMKLEIADENYVLELDATVVDGPNGIVEVGIVADDTADLEPGRYMISLWREDVGSEKALSFGSAFLQRSSR